MGVVESESNREPSERSHLRLNGTVAALHGWGQATPPKWNVRLELRDPGLFLITLGPARLPREVATIPINRLQLGVKAVQRSRGGGYVGGGFGIRGAIVGIAKAEALNRMTYSKWEETRLHVTERFPTGAHRRVTVTLSAATPASLQETLQPALATWADAWVDATLRGEAATFIDPAKLEMTLGEIQAMRQRQMLDADHALTLGSHFARPYLDDLRDRLLYQEVDHDAADEILTWLDHGVRHGLLRRRDLGPIRRLLQAVPPPAPETDRAGERERLLAHLEALRRTGAITQTELEAERTRLLGA